ncbi:MAG TPA: hemolysin family protein, partial [Candidatus Elarobacter sp.]|nr:hemolysin family protein [Candidatus Elarobacter sp.]
FFVGAEFALVRSRKTRLEAMARGGDPLARIALRATQNIANALSASQLGVTLTSLAIGWVAEASLVESVAGWVATLPLAIEISARITIATVIALALVTYLTVVFGELTPKTAALNNPERWARLLVPPLLAFAWIARPFTWLLNRSAAAVLRAMRQKPVPLEDTVHSPEELRMLVEQSEEGGAIEEQDAALLDAVFEFSEKNAREVMTPRTDIVALDITASLDEVIETVSESGLSRYPVYEETIDDIVGVVLAKDLIPVLAKRPATFSLRPLMRPVYFIPGTREVEDVLADFKRRKEHMAIVLDEYGGTAGVVTMEDLLEEIVGEILDEYDVAEESDVMMTTAGETIIAGTTNVSELNEHFGTTVPEDDSTTIGGFVFGVLGRLPVVGDRATAGGATFTVREMDGRRIQSLAMELGATSSETSGAQSAQQSAQQAASQR